MTTTKLIFARRSLDNTAFEVKFRIDDINTEARAIPLVSPRGVVIFDDESIALLDKYAADCARFTKYGQTFDPNENVKFYTLRLDGKVTPGPLTKKDVNGKTIRFFSGFNVGSTLTVSPWRKVIPPCELSI